MYLIGVGVGISSVGVQMNRCVCFDDKDSSSVGVH